MTGPTASVPTRRPPGRSRASLEPDQPESFPGEGRGPGAEGFRQVVCPSPASAGLDPAFARGTAVQTRPNSTLGTPGRLDGDHRVAGLERPGPVRGRQVDSLEARHDAGAGGSARRVADLEMEMRLGRVARRAEPPDRLAGPDPLARRDPSAARDEMGVDRIFAIAVIEDQGLARARSAARPIVRRRKAFRPRRRSAAER